MLSGYLRSVGSELSVQKERPLSFEVMVFEDD